MKNIKIKLSFATFFCVILCLFVTSTAKAATYSRANRVGSNTGGYQWAINVIGSFGYNSPGDGKIYSVADATYSNSACSAFPSGASASFACQVRPTQQSKSINSNRAAVTYSIDMNIYHYLSILGYQYYRTAPVKVTFVSPGPRSVPRIEYGEPYVDPELVGSVIND
ncbi:hypothetical protein A4S06_11695 [Erysipelotrichaceae bacterium MTC7]|nr:hypothetical protein A4S06_11695 [Erysipelotrichaceae bacterium MTC7]